MEEEIRKLKKKLEEKEEQVNSLINENNTFKKIIESNKLLKYKNIDDILFDKKLTKSMTGFQKNEFEELFQLIEKDMSMITTRGNPRKNIKAKKGKYNDREIFFITLYWMKNYPKDEFMSFFFNLSRKYLMKILKNTTEILYKRFSAFIKWPKEDEFLDYLEYFKNYTFEPFKNHICVVDGTEVQIRSPKKDQKDYYSVKKSQHSINFLIIVLLDGRMIYVSKGKNNFNDQSFWNKLKIRKKFVNKEYGIIGDGGFYFNPQKEEIEIKGIKPIKKDDKFSIIDQIFNESVAEIRVVVENTIGRIKNWNIIGGIFRHFSSIRGNIFDINKIFKICCYLTNYLIKKNPLRDSNWRQKNDPNAWNLFV